VLGNCVRGTRIDRNGSCLRMERSMFVGWGILKWLGACLAAVWRHLLLACTLTAILLPACTWPPHRRVEGGFFPPRREILRIFRTELICIMYAGLQSFKFCGHLRCNGEAKVYHIQQWTGVGVVTRTTEESGLDSRYGEMQLRGRVSYPLPSCLLGVRRCFLLVKSGSDGDYFRPSDSEMEDTVPPLHQALSLCNA
jgi:hypothetical protein